MSYVRLGTKIPTPDGLAEVIELSEEPNRGLCRVKLTRAHGTWEFMIPISLLEMLAESEARVVELEAEVKKSWTSEDSEFRCPECGSTHWGTSNCGGLISEWIGHCRACSFTWKRDEDHKVMWMVTRRPLERGKVDGRD